MLGISCDSVEENRAFAEKFGFEFPLLCDTTRATSIAYKALDRAEESYPRRFTYVISPEGRIETAIDTQDPAAQAGELLKRL
ncbi:MAG: hypothetical protein RL277_3008 [Planctomycetota bacterium]